MTAFVDTSAIYALIDRSDGGHWYGEPSTSGQAPVDHSARQQPGGDRADAAGQGTALAGICVVVCHIMAGQMGRPTWSATMLTVPEVARRLGRNPETIRRWIREGKLRAHKVGTQHIVDEEDLRSAAESEETLPLPPQWGRTITAERMPDVVAAVRRSRAGQAEL